MIPKPQLSDAALFARGPTVIPTPEFITPEIAARHLENRHANRPLNESGIYLIVGAMLNGLWCDNGQSISFCPDGRLIDGQNRLTALVRAGRSFWFSVSRGVEADQATFATIDIGKKRTVADNLHYAGVANASIVAAAARSALGYASATGHTKVHGVPETMLFVARHPYIHDAVSLTLSSRSIFSPSQLAAVLFLANNTRRRDRLAAEFAEGFASGAGLERGDPRLTLRNWFITARSTTGRYAKVTTEGTFIACVRAWNAWEARRAISVIRPTPSAHPIHLEIAGFDRATFPEFTLEPPIDLAPAPEPRPGGPLSPVGREVSP